jgi:hypothetical protein
VGKVVQARNREFNRLLANKMNEPGLTNEEKDRLYPMLEKQRGRYVYLNDRRLRFKEEEKLQELGEDIIEMKTNNIDISNAAQNVISSSGENALGNSDQVNIASALNNGPVTIGDNAGYLVHVPLEEEEIIDEEFINESAPQPVQYMHTFEGSEETEALENYVNYYYDLVTNPDSVFNIAEEDSPEYEPGSNEARRAYREKGIIDLDMLPPDLEFVTANEFVDIINSKGFDEAAYQEYNANIEKNIEKAKNVQSGEEVNFRYKMEYDNNKTFVANANIVSLAKNKIGPGDRVFQEDLYEFLTSQGSTYESLGIDLSKEEISRLDTNGGEVTPEDARKIVNEIIYNKKNRELFGNLMTSYLTDITRDVYFQSLDPSVLSASYERPSFMTPEEAEAKSKEIEEQRSLLTIDQTEQTKQNTYSPDGGLSFLRQ